MEKMKNNSNKFCNLLPMALKITIYFTQLSFPKLISTRVQEYASSI